MVTRKKRKKNGLRGHRKQGHGNTKNAKKGGGKRGGNGNAGSHKHTVTKHLARFTKHGFVNKSPITIFQTINLNDLNDLVFKVAHHLPVSENWKKLIKKDGNGMVVDLQNAFKVLSEGNLTSKIVLKNAWVSEKALEKLKASGSEVEVSERKEIPMAENKAAVETK